MCVCVCGAWLYGKAHVACFFFLDRGEGFQEPAEKGRKWLIPSSPPPLPSFLFPPSSTTTEDPFFLHFFFFSTLFRAESFFFNTDEQKHRSSCKIPSYVLLYVPVQSHFYPWKSMKASLSLYGTGASAVAGLIQWVSILQSCRTFGLNR